jgi:hypothetical protein
MQEKNYRPPLLLPSGAGSHRGENIEKDPLYLIGMHGAVGIGA